jgi:hypothetical protein
MGVVTSKAMASKRVVDGVVLLVAMAAGACTGQINGTSRRVARQCPRTAARLAVFALRSSRARIRVSNAWLRSVYRCHGDAWGESAEAQRLPKCHLATAVLASSRMVLGTASAFTRSRRSQ